jgi:hypothetical protein
MGAEVSAAGRCDWPPPVEYAVAVDRYLEQACLSPASRRVYRISLAAWAWPLAGRQPPRGTARRGARPPVLPLALLDDPDAADRLADGLAQRAERADVRTVNRELSALRSALGWWLELGWITRDPAAGLRHPGSPAGCAAAGLSAGDRASDGRLGSGRAALAVLPALSDRQAAAVFGLPVGLREATLWRLLRDSGWATEAALALDADSIDLAGQRVRGAGAGSCWRPETSKHLGWLLAGRTCGPVFLTDRRAPSGAARGDVCPVTGRARMSYRRAAELFTAYTRPLDPSGRGYTLHQLRRPIPASS